MPAPYLARLDFSELQLNLQYVLNFIQIPNETHPRPKHITSQISSSKDTNTLDLKIYQNNTGRPQ